MSSRAAFTKALAAVAVAGFVLIALPAASQAISGTNPTLTGVVTCDATTGNQVVTWTLTNASGTSVTVDSATVDDSGLSTGATIDTTATMTPNPVANGTTSTGATRAEGTATGDYHLVIAYTFAEADPTVDGEVVLPGGCEQTVATSTSTTTAAPTTTAPAAAAAAVAAAPQFTG